MGSCRIVSQKLTVKNDWCINNSHTKGWGPFSSVWHWFLSRWALAFDILWWLRFFVVCLLVWKCQGSVLWHHLPTDWEEHTSVAFKSGIGNCMTLKMLITLTVSRLSYVCSVTISEAKVYMSPLLLFCCYRAINVKNNTLKERFLCFALAYLAAQFK